MVKNIDNNIFYRTIGDKKNKNISYVKETTDSTTKHLTNLKCGFN